MVYFVGAGPGDTELITLKGVKLLKEADTVIYAGSLINHELLHYCREGARLIDSAHLSMEEIIDICKETEPGITVRLQTGDTALYSAISEQTALLDKENISYETVPGVSSFLAAAAALDIEYTLPGKSQSLIISRIEGRTPVPEREDIRVLASHGSSMVLFLSAGHTREVRDRLIEGGYSEDTPACIVYHASWPDEKVIHCRVGSLHSSAKENGITKTALLLIGDFLEGEGDKSLLYDASFTTGYRQGSVKRETVACCAFTDRGYELGNSLYPGACSRISRRDNGISLDEWTREHFYEAGALVFIGAVQIAVRAIAPYIQTKITDPAVVVIDESGQYVIPILSGHVGGGGRLALELEERLKDLGYNASSVITTASDNRQLFAADSWAASMGMKILNPEDIVRLQSDILKGKEIRVGSDFELTFPSGKTEIICERGYAKGQDMQVRVTGSGDRDGLIVIPRAATLGIGLKRGTSCRQIREAFEAFINENGIYSYAINSIASIDIKKDEEGLIEFAGELGLKIEFYSAGELDALSGDFTDSDFVRKVTGTGNVCERAALMSVIRHAGDQDADTDGHDESAGGRIICRKYARDGVTLALAIPQKL
ncbi:precorrin-4 C(11)-methyltransferase [Butyrivibrio sp. MC2013]|uniref:precorrin-4 C(11)-methyltransferase n=1 Tax=Butyrivibrio sp. MC2013 TaxID=1280686 RepID=UPI0004141087|nr:precorrin-4 C(11)-methyltransferase [Butyrivibrio sp. MC2013]